MNFRPIQLSIPILASLLFVGCASLEKSSIYDGKGLLRSVPKTIFEEAVEVSLIFTKHGEPQILFAAHH